jgi:hypothetical protein
MQCWWVWNKKLPAARWNMSQNEIVFTGTKSKWKWKSKHMLKCSMEASFMSSAQVQLLIPASSGSIQLETCAPICCGENGQQERYSLWHWSCTCCLSLALACACCQISLRVFFASASCWWNSSCSCSHPFSQASWSWSEPGVHKKWTVSPFH